MEQLPVYSRNPPTTTTTMTTTTSVPVILHYVIISILFCIFPIVIILFSTSTGTSECDKIYTSALFISKTVELVLFMLASIKYIIEYSLTREWNSIHYEFLTIPILLNCVWFIWGITVLDECSRQGIVIASTIVTVVMVGVVTVCSVSLYSVH